MYYINKKKKEKTKTKTARKKPNLVDKLDKVFSKYIRLRDSKQYGYRYFRCIACGQLKPYDQADCGHYVGRMHMNTRFDERNCHAECRACNRFTADHMIGYRKNLVLKYGEQNVSLLEYQGHITKKWSDFELEQLIKYYSVLVKRMEAEQRLMM